MFETVLGIPAHPLLVHAAVIFVPLQALSAVVYAFLPGLRPKITWAVVGLAVIGPGAAWFARLSGQAFRQRLIDHGLKDATFLGKIDAHQSFGDATSWATVALTAATVVLLLLSRRTTAADGSATAGVNAPVLLIWAVKLVVLALAAATAYYVFRTGDSGAHIVWGSQ